MKNATGYYNDKVLAKFFEAMKEAREAVKAGESLNVAISASNSKMGNVASVSLLPFLSCPGRCRHTCGVKCYAAKLANLRPAVLKSYARNQAIAMYRPEIYWSAVDLAMKANRFFRFHVSGDILNAEYFEKMVETVRNNPGTQVLVFTKRYEIVNAWIQENGDLPENLHLLFSGWENLEPENPYNLPETNVFKTEEEKRESWKTCGGNCFNCACSNGGCWHAGKNETIAFKIH